MGMHKDKVMDGGPETVDYLLVDTFRYTYHRNKTLDTGLVEGLLNFEFTTVGDIHGVP